MAPMRFPLPLLFFLSLLCPVPLSYGGEPGWAERGLAAYAQQNYPLAIDYLQKATETSHQSPVWAYYLANSYVKTQQWEKASSTYQWVLAIAPYSQAGQYSQQALVHLYQFLKKQKSSVWQAEVGTPDFFQGEANLKTQLKGKLPLEE